jgi:hypothetical protein
MRNKALAVRSISEMTENQAQVVPDFWALTLLACTDRACTGAEF